VLFRSHGAEAAYLALHYGGMEAGAARVLLEDLAAEVDQLLQFKQTAAVLRQGQAVHHHLPMLAEL
jgi:hypothetical protein